MTSLKFHCGHKPGRWPLSFLEWLKQANQNKVHQWHHPKPTNSIEAVTPDKQRHWKCTSYPYAQQKQASNRLSPLNVTFGLLLTFCCQCLKIKNKARTKVTLTGVRSSGVEMGELSLLSLIPLPRSKSQIFTGEIYKKRTENQTRTSQKWLTAICRHAFWMFTLWLETLKPQTFLSSHLNHKCKMYFECDYTGKQMLKLTLSSYSHKMFSGFRSRWAIPAHKWKSHVSSVEFRPSEVCQLGEAIIVGKCCCCLAPLYLV